MLSARSLISFGAISSFTAAIIVLFATCLTSVAFANERRSLAVAADDRGYVGGPLAYANPENDDLGRRYYARPRQARTQPSGPPLDAAVVSVVPMPNLVVVNGQEIEIVSPSELNTIDLATDTSSLEQAALRSPPVDTRATTTLLAQALSTIAGALAGLSVGLFLIKWRSVRIELHKSLEGTGRRTSGYPAMQRARDSELIFPIKDAASAALMLVKADCLHAAGTIAEAEKQQVHSRACTFLDDATFKKAAFLKSRKICNAAVLQVRQSLAEEYPRA
jgi:hypothetical protein